MPGRRNAIIFLLGLVTGICLAAALILIATERTAFAQKLTPTGLCASCHSSSELSDHPDVPVRDCVACHAPHSLEAAPKLKPPARDRCQDCHFEYASLRFKQRVQSEGIKPHKPAEKGECLECHGAHGEGEKPALKSDGSELCIGCHKNQVPANAAAGAHQPFSEGKCQACHDPHGGPGAMLTKPPAELCISCHQQTKEEQSLPNKHAPFGQCMDCHNGHQSAQPKLLKMETKRLCYTCHKTHEQLWNDKPVKHPPFQEGVCTTCHSPHASKEKALVKFYPLQELCFQCHSDKQERFAAAESRHPLGMYGKKTGAGPMFCVDCHNPHAGDFSKMRQREGNLLCLGCHDWPYFFTTPHAEVEGRGGKGQCTNCHNPHGTSNTFMLLVDPVTTCEQCHPRASSLFQHPVGDRLDPDKLRLLTCASTCHNPHGSGLNKLLRKSKDALCITCHRDRGVD